MLNLQYVFKLELSRSQWSISPWNPAFKVMKKALSSVIIFCFSVSTYADIYVCESKIDGQIVAPTVLSKSHIREDGGPFFIIDSEQGIREIDGTKHTAEPCRMSSEFLICMSSFDGIGINSFAIDTRNYTFTYVEQNYQVRISSYYGTCIKGSWKAANKNLVFLLGTIVTISIFISGDK